MKKYRFVIFIITLFIVSLTASKKLQQTKSELDRTKELIKQKTTEKKKYAARETEVVKELKKIETELKNIEQEKQELIKKIKTIEKQLLVTKRDIEILDTDIEFYQKFLAIELNNFVNKYIILKPFYENNMLRKLKKLAMRERFKQLQTTQSQRNYAEQLNREYLKRKFELEGYNKKLAEKQKKQKLLFIGKNNLLKKLQSEEIKIDEQIKQLKRTQQELELVLKKLEQKKKKDLAMRTKHDIPKIKEKFIRPVSGEIVSTFGKEKLEKDGTYVIKNGITIQGISNDNVVAVESGKVIFISNDFRSYGKMIIIEHKNELYSVYGQLGKIDVTEKQQIMKSQVIGKTNSQGKMYFELRKNLIPINPELHFEQ